MSEQGCDFQLSMTVPPNMTENMQLTRSPVNLTFLTCLLKFFPRNWTFINPFILKLLKLCLSGFADF